MLRRVIGEDIELAVRDSPPISVRCEPIPGQIEQVHHEPGRECARRDAERRAV